MGNDRKLQISSDEMEFTFLGKRRTIFLKKCEKRSIQNFIRLSINQKILFSHLKFWDVYVHYL